MARASSVQLKAFEASRQAREQQAEAERRTGRRRHAQKRIREAFDTLATVKGVVLSGEDRRNAILRALNRRPGPHPEFKRSTIQNWDAGKLPKQILWLAHIAAESGAPADYLLGLTDEGSRKAPADRWLAASLRNVIEQHFVEARIPDAVLREFRGSPDEIAPAISRALALYITQRSHEERNKTAAEGKRRAERLLLEREIAAHRVLVHKWKPQIRADARKAIGRALRQLKREDCDIAEVRFSYYDHFQDLARRADSEARLQSQLAKLAKGLQADEAADADRSK